MAVAEPSNWHRWESQFSVVAGCFQWAQKRDGSSMQHDCNMKGWLADNVVAIHGG
jgi:hypothetical protein